MNSLPTEFLSLINVETMIPSQHPIRVIKRRCDEVLRGMSGHFDEHRRGLRVLF